MVNNVIVVSHRRSGTHFLIDAIINNFDCYSNVEYLTLEQVMPYPEYQQTELPAFRKIVEENKANVFKTHLISNFRSLGLPNDVEDYLSETFAASKKIYIKRDGRDVMVSLFNYMKGFDDKVACGSFNEFLRGKNVFDRGEYNQINRVRYWQRHVEEWRNSELGKTALFVSYEDLFLDFENTLKEIARFLEQPLREPIVNVAMERAKKLEKFERRIKKVMQLLRLSTIKRTSIGFHTGGIGKYENYFSASDLEFYNQQIST